jgi:predicted DNA-binding protein
MTEKKARFFFKGTPELHKQVKLMSVETGRTLESICIEALEQWLERQQDNSPK